MLELLVQSWILLTVSLLTVLAVVIGVQRAVRAVRQVLAGLRRGVEIQVPAPERQLYAVPTRH